MIAGVVVLYNPNIIKVLNNLKSYLPYLDKLYVVDNSNASNEESFKDTKIEYIFLNGNKGISYALKLGCLKAIEENFNYLLTMDQDSSFDGNFEEYLDLIKSINMDNVALVAPKYISNEKVNIEEVNMVITSGNIINLNLYKNIEGFNEDLFIDFVDFDLCYQFKEKGYSILQFNKILLKHELGDNIRKKLFSKSFLVTNHSPLRMYYMYRNMYYCSNLSKDRKKFFKPLKKNYYLKDIIKLMLFEDYKFKKIKMIKKGIKDAKKGKLGAYKED